MQMIAKFSVIYAGMETAKLLPKIHLLANYCRLGKLSAPQTSQTDWKLLVKSTITNRVCFCSFRICFCCGGANGMYIVHAMVRKNSNFMYIVHSLIRRNLRRKVRKKIDCAVKRCEKLVFHFFPLLCELRYHPRSFKLLAAKRFLLVSYHIITSHIPCMNIV